MLFHKKKLKKKTINLILEHIQLKSLLHILHLPVLVYKKRKYWNM